MTKVITHASNKENIHKEAEHVWIETLDRLVPKPPPKPVQSDLLLTLTIFRNIIWWMELWWDQKQSTKNEIYEELEARLTFTDLNTGLKPTFGLNTAKHNFNNLKSFLDALERNLFNKYLQQQCFKVNNRKIRDIEVIIQSLNKYDNVCMLIHKTKTTLLIPVAAYKIWVTNHLLEAAGIYLHPKLIKLFGELNKMINDANMDQSGQEYQFVRKLLTTWAPPS